MLPHTMTLLSPHITRGSAGGQRGVSFTWSAWYVWKLNQAAEFCLFLKKHTRFLSNRVSCQLFFLFIHLKHTIHTNQAQTVVYSTLNAPKVYTSSEWNSAIAFCCYGKKTISQSRHFSSGQPAAAICFVTDLPLAGYLNYLYPSSSSAKMEKTIIVIQQNLTKWSQGWNQSFHEMLGGDHPLNSRRKK